ncbi:MAG: glutamine--tRNA ligase/YqeY domain fusion protein [Acidobacteriota bacterium]
MSGNGNNDSVDTAGLDFIRTIVAEDNAKGTYGGRVATRFPPEPNGFLHIGHATSICLNFGVARENDGTCNLRFDDTNPTTEDPRYVAAIEDDVRWLGFEWDGKYFASDYFEQLYKWAEQLVIHGKAYVDSSSEEEIREYRGTVTSPGKPSPYRGRSPEESLDLFRRMRAGEFEDGAHVLRARIDMAHPNMKMRDPLLYRIRHAHHYRTGDEWCIYPMYDYAHPLSDAIENITHSLCTLEFENNRAIYDWLIDNVDVGDAHPRQYEFARLNLDYTVMSKRKLLRLVQEDWVEGWDDPRMPTISGMRRRGIRPEAIRAFADLVGIAKANSRVDIGKLEYAVREDLNPEVRRVMCVLDPLKVVVTNYPDAAGGDSEGAPPGASGRADEAHALEQLEAPYYPHDVPKEGSRMVPFTRELFIERDDFMEDPPDSFFRLAPGREVRLRYGYFIKCNEVVKDESGRIVELRCTYDPATRGGAAPDGRKVKGTIHWVSAEHAVPVEVRLYDRLFTVANPDEAAAETGKDFTEFINAESRVTVADARLEPAVAAIDPGEWVQFERQGYFFTDPQDTMPGTPVFNRVVTLRDTWAKIAAKEETSAEEPGEEPESEDIGNDQRGDAAERRKRTRRSGADLRDRARARNAELAERYRRYCEDLGLSDDDADLLTGETSVAELFEAAVAAHDAPQEVANWLINEVAPYFDDGKADELPFGGAELGALIALVDDGTVSRPAAKDVLAIMAEKGGEPGAIVEARGLQQVTDADAIAVAVDDAIAAYPDKVAEYREGRTGLAGFFIGQVMRATGGTADPEMVNRLVRNRLDG